MVWDLDDNFMGRFICKDRRSPQPSPADKQTHGCDFTDQIIHSWFLPFKDAKKDSPGPVVSNRIISIIEAWKTATDPDGCTKNLRDQSHAKEGYDVITFTS